MLIFTYCTPCLCHFPWQCHSCVPCPFPCVLGKFDFVGRPCWAWWPDIWWCIYVVLFAYRAYYYCILACLERHLFTSMNPKHPNHFLFKSSDRASSCSKLKSICLKRILFQNLTILMGWSGNNCEKKDSKYEGYLKWYKPGCRMRLRMQRVGFEPVF